MSDRKPSARRPSRDDDEEEAPPPKKTSGTQKSLKKKTSSARKAARVELARPTLARGNMTGSFSNHHKRQLTVIYVGAI